MAFRAAATSNLAGGGSTSFVVNMPSGLTSGDQMLVLVSIDQNGGTITPPSGFTQIAIQGMSGPDGQELKLYTRVADGTEGSTQTWTITNVAAIAIAACWSGRASAALTSSNVVVTANTTGNTTPISESITGITASANDDLAVFTGLDMTAADTWTWSAISGFTNRNTVNVGFSLGNFQSEDNVGAGATGSLTATITRQTGTGTAGYTGFVARIPVASGGSNTTITPTVGSVSTSGNTPTVTPGTVTPITPLTARRTKSGLLVCERKIFLPPWRRKAA